jgi:hypothetical protein
MRRLVFVLTIMVLLLSAWPAGACGDTLLALGRGVRFQVDTADYPASILYYLNPNSPGSEKVEFTKFQAIMRQAGHRFHIAKGREELAAALKTARFDIVLADFADAPRIEEMIQSSASQPVVLPWVFRQKTKVMLTAATERYHYALEAPFKVEPFLSTIDRTMELKTKQARAKAKTTSPTNVSLVH